MMAATRPSSTSSYLPRLQRPESSPDRSYVYPTAEDSFAGDLNQIVDQQQGGKPVINPFTGEPFPNNIIPANMLSPVAQATFKYLPLPNFGPRAICSITSTAFNSA